MGADDLEGGAGRQQRAGSRGSASGATARVVHKQEAGDPQQKRTTLRCHGWGPQGGTLRQVAVAVPAAICSGGDRRFIGRAEARSIAMKVGKRPA